MRSTHRGAKAVNWRGSGGAGGMTFWFELALEAEMQKKHRRGASILNRSILFLATAAAVPMIVAPLASGATFTWDSDGVANGVVQDGGGDWNLSDPRFTNN